MVDFFDKLYTSIRNKNKVLIRIRFYSLCRICLRKIANAFLPVYFTFTQNNPKHQVSSNTNDIIMSLTSFPERIDKLWITIETLLRQSRKPDKIILWLSKEQFSDTKELPRKLLNQQDRGLEIRLVDEDLRSHKKYYYALCEFPESQLVLVDDDIFYRSTMIADLLLYKEKYPKSVISQYSRRIKRNDKGAILSYSQWKAVYKEEIYSENLFLGTGGGTLIPPFSLYKDVTDKNLFLSLCPTADDIWINAMIRLNGWTITKTSYYSANLPVLSRKKINLSSLNRGENFNDVQIKAVNDFYLKNRKQKVF